MAKYFIRRSNGKLSQKNTEKMNKTNKQKRRNIINYQLPKPNHLTNKKIEKSKPLLTTGKKMLSQVKTFEMEKKKSQAEIQSAIEGYKKIIETLHDKIKSNNKTIEEFTTIIQQNLKEMESLKGDKSIILSFKNKMEDMLQLHNESLIKDNANCDKLISDTEENIKMLEKKLEDVSKMGLTRLGTNM
jgi:bacterioferritin (cytochrome b1)